MHAPSLAISAATSEWDVSLSMTRLGLVAGRPWTETLKREVSGDQKQCSLGLWSFREKVGAETQHHPARDEAAPALSGERSR